MKRIGATVGLNLTGPLRVLGRDLVRLREAGIPFLMHSAGAKLGSRRVARQYGGIFGSQSTEATATIYVRPCDAELVPYTIYTTAKPTNEHGLRYDLIPPTN